MFFYIGNDEILCKFGETLFLHVNFPVHLGPEGMEKFCEDIGVEPENVVMLVLAWKMNARQMGFFTLQEWTKGLTDLQ